MLDLQGHPLSFWLYPPFPWRGAFRRRTYAVLRYDTIQHAAQIVDETGELHIVPDSGEAFYDQLRALIVDNRTVYCPNLRIGSRNAGILYRALTDRGASVIYSPKRGLMGYRFTKGRKHGALLGMGAWGPYDGQTVRFLSHLRLLSDRCGLGDYDTAGALGAASLARFWSEQQLPYQLRLCDGLTEALNRYQIGGRAEAPGLAGVGECVPYATELDLSSAYPTAVARGLPAGRICYHNREPQHSDRAAVFGIWRIRVHGLIETSPVPWRDWGVDGNPLLWCLTPDMEEWEYAGWLDEIEALRASGQANADWLYGWSWPRLDSMLAPWVDELGDLRQQCEHEGMPEIAKLVKLAANAAIGRWGMAPEQYSLVPDAEHDLSLGDLPLQVEDGSLVECLTGAWVRLVSDEARYATPYHWCSYVRMAVRMELWRRQVAIQRAGGRVIQTNFDAVWVAGGEPIVPMTADTDAHPWVWRPKQRYRVVVSGPRHVIWEDSHGIQVTLPGISGAMRMSMLVDAQRRRQAALLEAQKASGQ